MSFDFSTLDPIDFENLTCDLLNKRLGISLESFKEGKDQGIDLRFAVGKSGKLIIQCKHYLKSGFSNLKSKLLNAEVPKIVKLNPSRYILVTTVPLSPKEKEELEEILKPYCRGTGDIYGQDDLNQMLRESPEIVRAHYKLWLSSASVLERVLNNKMFTQKYVAEEQVKKRLSLYVDIPEVFNKSIDILEKNHSLIISGTPGIGKTTLAEMLLINYINQGYEVFTITGDVNEAFEVDHSEKKRVYLYDDFLGQIDLISLNKNEDGRLKSFIENLKDTANRRLILTTREYILVEAQKKYEKLKDDHGSFSKLILDIGSLSRVDKARMLYKHLYFHDVDHSFIKELVKDKKIIKAIINHENFNPRVIETVCKNYQNSITDPTEFGKAFLNTLNCPEALWENAFDSHLVDNSKALLMTLAIIEDGIYLEDVKLQFQAVFKKYSDIFLGGKRSLNDFRDALRVLDKSFIRIEKQKGKHYIFFYNPSVREFIYKKLSSNEELLKILFEELRYSQQYKIFWEQAKRVRVKGFNTFMKSHSEQFFYSLLGSLGNGCYEKKGDLHKEFTDSRHIVDGLILLSEIAQSFAKEEKQSSVEALIKKAFSLITSEKVRYSSQIFQIVRDLTKKNIFCDLPNGIFTRTLESYSFENSCKEFLSLAFKKVESNSYDVSGLETYVNFVELIPAIEEISEGVDEKDLIDTINEDIANECNDLDRELDDLVMFKDSVEVIVDFFNLPTSKIELDELEEKIEDIEKKIENEADMQFEDYRISKHEERKSYNSDEYLDDFDTIDDE